MSKPNKEFDSSHTYENGVPMGEGVLMVYNVIQDQNQGKFFISLEVRDYSKNYCRMMYIPKEFLNEMLQRVAVAESLGMKYDEAGGRLFVDYMGDKNK